MLRVLQWAYGLGVRNERQRIATYLSSAQGERLNRMNDPFAYDPPVTSKKDAIEKAKRKNELKKAVDKEVIEIIAGLFQAQDKYVRGESILFPEGEEK
ncbi:MAG: hypothetical protein V4563_18175 [Pseudomonadota bacterium]